MSEVEGGFSGGSFTGDLRRYAGITRHWAWLILLTTVLAGGLAFIVSRQITPIYEGTTTVLVNEPTTGADSNYTAILTSERLTRTYAEMMTKSQVLAGVEKNLGLTMKIEDLTRAIDVSPVRDTQLIEIKARNADPQLAAGIANQIVAVFSDQVQALQASRFSESKQSLETELAATDQKIKETSDALQKLGGNDQASRDRLESALVQYRQSYTSLLQSYEQVRLAEAESTSNVIQVEPAQPPEKPVLPRTLLNVSLACVLGFLLGLGIAFLLEALDNTLRTPEDVSGQLGLPVLGVIADSHFANDRPAVIAEPRSPVAEAFRTLRTNLQFASVDVPLRTILVTSPSPGEGKSTIAANLATVIAQGGKRVVILDADMRRPTVHQIFDVKNENGLTDLVLNGNHNPGHQTQQTTVEGLTVLTSGELPPNPVELLGSEKMSALIEAISRQADVVVIDSPPVLMVTDSSVLAQRVDGVLLVIRQGETNLEIARQSLEQLQRVGANVVGAVLNGVKFGRSSYYYHYKDYYQGENGRFRGGSRLKLRKRADHSNRSN
jgi:non-specific protein-tyrosine kinase